MKGFVLGGGGGDPLWLMGIWRERVSVGLVVNNREVEKSADPTVLSWFLTWIMLPANPTSSVWIG